MDTLPPRRPLQSPAGAGFGVTEWQPGATIAQAQPLRQPHGTILPPSPGATIGDNIRHLPPVRAVVPGGVQSQAEHDRLKTYYLAQAAPAAPGNTPPQPLPAPYHTWPDPRIDPGAQY